MASTDHFETQRPRLRAVAYRMLGSMSEADDAVQEAWLRLDRSAGAEIENVDAWLTTVVARICLNLLRTRANRREVHVPDPIIDRADGVDPEHEAVLADAVGLALLVVLDTLSPPERLAFVLHDMFAVPFDDIAPMLDRSPAAARQLASRARRRVQGRAPAPDKDIARQRRVVDAFFAAARDGDFEALVAVLDPQVVLRADGGTGLSRRTVVIHGSREVAGQAVLAARLAPFVRPALINGTPGVVVIVNGHLQSIMAFTVSRDHITAIEVLLDPDRLKAVDLRALPSENGGTSSE